MSSCRLYSPDHKGVVFLNWKVAGSIPWYSKYFAQIRLVFDASERVINKQPVVAKGEPSLKVFLPYQCLKLNPNFKILIPYWEVFKSGLIFCMH